MDYSGYDHLKLELPCAIQSLRQLAIKIRPNEHGIAKFQAIIGDTDQFSALEKQLIGEPIKIIDQEKGTLFGGMLKQFTITRTKGYYLLEGEGITATARLDVTPKSRSFQDSEMLYRNLVKAVLTGIDQASVICTEGITETIKTPIIQYRETDWAFCKRLASHFDAMLIPEATENQPRFWFGMRKGQVCKQPFDQSSYIVKKNYGRYLAMGGEEKEGFRERDCFTYQVESAENYPIGDKTTFCGKEMTICAKSVTLSQGQLIFNYTLGYPKGFGTIRYDNKAIQGISIPGKIIDRKDEKLKIHLSIDESQEIGKAHWYAYTPLTGNQLYAMPNIGEIVNLNMDTANENESRLSHSTRNNPEESKIAEPSNRYFVTNAHKELALLPGELRATDGGNTITLVDKNGITVETKQAISMKAAGNIIMQAGAVSIKGQSKIKMNQKKDSGSLLIKNEFNTMGAKGLMETGGGAATEAPAKKSKSNVNPLNAVMSALGGIAH